MNRNVIAIIGSAASLATPGQLAVAEQLAKSLAEKNFDLVTGGMDGVMRAVAKGHARATKTTGLIALHPGWGKSWMTNPHGRAVVKTELGTMRNHLVVGAGDLVIAIGGGSGTLSEISIAWQMHKPIAALVGHGGWSERLAGESLDTRSGTIQPCSSVAEMVSWAEQLRPTGVYTGRLNRDLYPREVPALHRIRPADASAPAEGTDSPAHDLQAQFGMSVTQQQLKKRLRQLDAQVMQWNQEQYADDRALVSFDDGWSDVCALIPLFRQLKQLQPVVFVGANHFVQPVHPLPLQRLYQHCAEGGCDQQTFREMRGQFKQMPQREQERVLQQQRVPEFLDPPWLLNLEDIARLRAEGWLIASHGPLHEDLRKCPDLADRLQENLQLMEEQQLMPWLAWPEGQWDISAFEQAQQAGFTLQFGLQEEPHGECPDGLVLRSIWN